jgi:DNA-binding LacI/PurR family transcriptional regulator
LSVTLDDVARRVGVSRTLVSLALRDNPRVADSTRRAIHKAAADLGYRPNLLARHLASTSTATVGVVLTELRNPIFVDIYEGLAESAGALGYRTLLAAGSVDSKIEQEAVQLLVDFRVDALALVGTSLPTPLLSGFAARLPTVLVGRRAAGVDVVSVDDRHGARLAVEHLVGLGHKRIAHVDGGNGHGASLRRSAYIDVMKENGLAKNVQVVRGAYTEAGGEAGAESLFLRRPLPTAIFAANDLAALGVLAVARRHRLAVPEQLSVVGFDDAWVASFNYVALTTVEQPRREIAMAAMDLLSRRLQDRGVPTRRMLIEPSLVVRETSAGLNV